MGEGLPYKASPFSWVTFYKQKEGVFMVNTLRRFWKDERGGILTAETIGYVLLFTGAAALVGYGLSVAYRGLAGKNVLIIKCADPAYADDPRCSDL